jgi:acetamidase/formamidase
MPREHVIDGSRVHHAWDASLEPTLRIQPGDVVHFDLKMAGHGQIRQGISYEHTTVDFATLYHLLGPIHVEGARPGDALEIDILELTPGAWGWCAVLPQLGLPPEDFPDPFIRYFDLSAGDLTELVPGVPIPINPFLGVMGTLPDDIDTASAFPPRTKEAATSTPGTSPKAPRCSCPSSATARCSPAATRTRHRATARCASAPSKPT